MASNLGLYSGSSALLSPTSPSASNSVPSLSQDSQMPGRHADDRDRASPIASAAGSRETRDSISGNNAASISSSNATSNKRVDRLSRDSLDSKSSCTSSQSRAHSHATLRSDGPGHQERSNGGQKESTGSSHRRSSLVSPESSRRDSPEIKKENGTDSHGALKDVSSKSSHTLQMETKIKDEKSDTNKSRVNSSSTKKQVEHTNGRENLQEDKTVSRDNQSSAGGSEKGNCGDDSGNVDSRQIGTLSVDTSDSDNVKTEKISPVASTSDKKGHSSEKSKIHTEVTADKKEKVESNIDCKEPPNNNAEANGKSEKVQVDGDFASAEEDRRKSTDSSLRSEPIDIRPQRDIKESASPEKMGSEVSLAGRRGSSAAPGETSPAAQKDPNRVKQEKSPSGSSGSSAGPAKVLTTGSGGVVYAMYSAG